MRTVLLLSLAVASLVPATGQVVISQVYGGGGNAGAPYTNDFMELFNRGNAPVSLNGLSVQYASATGTGNFVATVLPNVTLQPGQYFLVQQGGGLNGVALPTADATGTTAMSATGGKVALVSIATSLACNGGSTVCNATQLGQILDLVGYDGANFFEGAATPVLSNTTAARRTSSCIDTNNNLADFTVGTPTPRNTASPLSPCGPPPPVPTISISSVSLSEGHAGTTNYVFNVNLTSAAAATVTFTVNTQAVSATSPDDFVALVNVPGSITAGQTQTTVTVQVNGDTTFEPQETFQVALSAVTNATPGTVTGTGTIQNDDPLPFFCDGPGTSPIHTIQGSGAASGMTGLIVEIQGILTGDFQGSSKLRGFYLQEEVADADPATSEGIFVFDNTSAVNVSPGDKVRVRGTVTEFGGLTEIGTVTNVLPCGTGLVTATSVHLPLPQGTTFERYEGMVVTFDAPLYVTGNFRLERFGEVDLASTRLPNPTHVAAPGASAVAQKALNDRSRIVLDDDINTQNTFPTLYPQGGLSAANTLRAGDMLNGPIVAVVDDAFGRYALRPLQPYFFSPLNARPVAAPAVPGRLRVTAFNVLNYFTTLDVPGNTCGPSNLDCRGANTTPEFARQRAKIVAAIHALNPDIAGLTELENNSVASLQDLVSGLNTAAGYSKYAYISTGTIEGDAIKVGFIYQLARATPVGLHRILNIGDNLNRPALAQDFAPFGSTWPGERTTVVVNHFKSKGANAACGADPGDGQGNCNAVRLNMAQALSAWLATNPTGNPAPAWDRNVLIIGDLNAYRLEDPIMHLKNAGFTDLIESFQGLNGYSYVFDGETGYLDHGLSNASLKRRVTGAADWHINADEPIALDYNSEFKGTGNGMSAAALAAYYSADPFRSSDHDPLLIGFNPLLGDFNDDGVLDAADRTALLGARGIPADARMDMDGDGAVTQEDFHIWQDYFQSWKKGRY